MNENANSSQTKALPTVFIHGESLDRVSYPEECPFNTSRTARTRNTIESMGLIDDATRIIIEPEAAERDVLLSFHTPAYLDALQEAAKGNITHAMGDMGFGTPDCPIFDDMYTHPAMACGATLTGARLISEGKTRRVFSPSGGFHHAFPARAGGFCYLNDVVIACMELSREGKRVMFIDVDVHHCDGVQHAFYERDDVLVVSLHENGKSLFPGTGFEREIGTGSGAGYNVNIPLPVGTDDMAYLRAFREIVPPLAKAYAPDVIVMECGMDALSGDPLAHLHLTNNAYAEVLEAVMGFNVPLLLTGGGGYNVENTVRGWALLWSILCEEPSQDDWALGLGGVMLQGTDWLGGLRDQPMISHGGQRKAIDNAIDDSLRMVQSLVFPAHGISQDA